MPLTSSAGIASRWKIASSSLCAASVTRMSTPCVRVSPYIQRRTRRRRLVNTRQVLLDAQEPLLVHALEPQHGTNRGMAEAAGVLLADDEPDQIGRAQVRCISSPNSTCRSTIAVATHGTDRVRRSDGRFSRDGRQRGDLGGALGDGPRSALVCGADHPSAALPAP